jgi:monoamine oxidase
MSLTRRIFIERVPEMGGYSAAFSAMNTLGLMPGAGESVLPKLELNFGGGKSVVVLGAGIADLGAAYELHKAGFKVMLLEARNRPGGRDWTVRAGSKVEFTDGFAQNCTWSDGSYKNVGPARIPSIHTNLSNAAKNLACPLRSRSIPPALLSCSLLCSMEASNVWQTPLTNPRICSQICSGVRG